MHKDLEQLRTELSSELTGLSARDTQRAPQGYPEKWSIQQIAEHLLLTYRVTAQQLQERLAKGVPTRSKTTLWQHLARWSVLSLGRFPAGRKATDAISPTRPATLRTGAELIQRIDVELAPLDALLRKGEKLFGSRRALGHPELGPLSMQQWRRFHVIHGQHHFRQIRAIRREESVA